MHLTSLPGPLGSGDLSSAAHEFVDFLSDAGQTWWQMLPVVPPGEPPGNSPYSSSSSFAGSPYLVSPQALAAAGLLDRRAAVTPPRGASDKKVNFPAIRRRRDQLLREAFATARDRGDFGKSDFLAFCESNADWLDDYALYCALRGRFKRASWTEWDRDLRRRKPAALRAAREALGDEVHFHRFVQFHFDLQWRALRAHAGKQRVGLIGDLPIFVALDSADVWSNPSLFDLDRDGQPRHVSGYPPDSFTPEGQLWGHPQYRWSEHERTDFAWWVRRVARVFELFDAVRIDHFLGFTRVWSVPAEASAAAGRWVATPGHALLTRLREKLGERPIIAEDLGLGTPESDALRDSFELPGMRIFQLGFDNDGRPVLADHLPHNFPRRCVAYTGTHDNDTLIGWFRQLRNNAARQRVLRYTGGALATAHREMIRSVMSSAADTVIFPVQDILGLGAGARFNVPGRAEGNWNWRLPPHAIERLAGELAEAAALFGRRSAESAATP